MLITIIGGLHVYPDRMRTNLDLTGGLITGKGVMTALAGTVGRQQADDIVHHAALQASTTGGTFLDTLGADPRVRFRERGR